MNTKKLITSIRDPDTGEKLLIRLQVIKSQNDIMEVLADRNLSPALSQAVILKVQRFAELKSALNIFRGIQSDILMNLHEFLVHIFARYGKNYYNFAEDKKSLFWGFDQIVINIVDDILSRGETFDTKDVYTVEYPLAILIAIADQILGKQLADILIKIVESKLNTKTNFYAKNDILKYLVAFIDGFRGRLSEKEAFSLLDYNAAKKMMYFLDHLVVYGALYSGVDVDKIYNGTLSDDVSFVNAIMCGKVDEDRLKYLISNIEAAFDLQEFYEGSKNIWAKMKSINLTNRHYRQVIRLMLLFSQSKHIMNSSGFVIKFDGINSGGFDLTKVMVQ